LALAAGPSEVEDRWNELDHDREQRHQPRVTSKPCYGWGLISDDPRSLRHLRSVVSRAARVKSDHPDSCGIGGPAPASNRSLRLASIVGVGAAVVIGPAGRVQPSLIDDIGVRVTVLSQRTFPLTLVGKVVRCLQIPRSRQCVKRSDSREDPNRILAPGAAGPDRSRHCLRRNSVGTITDCSRAR
jgi:hypothetical protein